MGVAKVILNGTTLIDTTGKTVAANKMLSGATALDKAGEGISGNITSKSAQTYTPGTTNQTIASGQYLSGTQTISGDANLVAANIASGVSIFGVTGTYAGGTYTITLLSTGTTNERYVKYGNTKYYTSGDTITVTAGDSVTVGLYGSGTNRTYLDDVQVSTDTAYTYTPTKDSTIEFTVTTSAGDRNIVARIYNAVLPTSRKAATTYTPTTADQTIPSGTYLTGTQTISGDANLVAGNIKDGTTIFGILGTFTGGGGGLEYEEGTWTTSYDIATATLSFTNTHTDPPFFYVFYDASGADGLTSSSNCICVWTDFNQLSDTTLPESSSNVVYAVASYYYMTSATDMSMSYSCINYPYSDTSVSAKYYYRYWCTASQLKARSASSSRYWRTGRTYKWIAAWKPTT